MLIYVDIYSYLADVKMHCILNYMRRHETHVHTHFAQLYRVASCVMHSVVCIFNEWSKTKGQRKAL